MAYPSSAPYREELRHSWSKVDQSGRHILDREKVRRGTEKSLSLLGPRRNFSMMPPVDRAVEIFPGISTRTSMEPSVPYARFLLDLRFKLEENIGLAEQEKGVLTTNGLVGDLSRLQTLAGHGMRPDPTPDYDNRYRAPESWVKPRHREIFIEVLKAMFGEWDPTTPYRIQKKSSSVFPRFTTDMDYKLGIAREGLRNFGEIKKKVRNRQLPDLYTDHQWIFAHSATHRDQADRVTRDEDGTFRPKDRVVYGQKWLFGEADKPAIASRYIDDFAPPVFRTRKRLAYGHCGPVNYVMGMIMSGYRDVYLGRYGATWVTRPGDLAHFANGHEVVGVDVSQFDQQYPLFVVREFCEFIADRWGDEVATVFWWMWTCPTFVKAQSKIDPEIWLGDPFNLDTFGASVGLPSGIANNPDMGKLWGTSVGLILMDEAFGDVLEVGVPTILCHKWTRALKNSADDMVFGLLPGDRPSFDQALTSDAVSAYLTLEPEEPISYLGRVLTQSGTRTYSEIPNVNSYVVNWFVPERSFGANFREYAAAGWYFRKAAYEDSPAFRTVEQWTEKVFAEHFGTSVNSLISRMAEDQRQLLGLLTADDFELLTSPEKMFYSNLANSGVTAAAILSETIHSDEIREWLAPHYNG